MQNPISQVFLGDNIELMKSYPDNHFNLALIDPPYGIGEDGKKNHSRGNFVESTKYTPKEWDKEPPPAEYFEQLFRISKNQIIFGANHFINLIPFASPCWIVWDKQTGTNDFADCELAWTSFKGAVRKFEFRWSGMLQGNMKEKEVRIHPTQKPVQLYKWLLQNYAKQGDTIFDSHMGSQSSRIAAYQMGFDYTGIEKDEEYMSEGNKRFENAIKAIESKPDIFKVHFKQKPKATPSVNQLIFS